MLITSSTMAAETSMMLLLWFIMSYCRLEANRVWFRLCWWLSLLTTSSCWHVPCSWQVQLLIIIPIWIVIYVWFFTMSSICTMFEIEYHLFSTDACINYERLYMCSVILLELLLFQVVGCLSQRDKMKLWNTHMDIFTNMQWLICVSITSIFAPLPHSPHPPHSQPPAFVP